MCNFVNSANDVIRAKVLEGKLLGETFRISKENREQMISQIKEYFINERDEDLGDLAAALILDFFTEQLAPLFYNQGIFDSYQYMSDKIGDLLEIQMDMRDK